jgi:hypothetical protein
MTTDLAVTAAQDATQAQEPSTVEVNTDPQAPEGNTPEPKEELVPLKKVNRMRAALGDKERQLQAAQERIREYESKLAAQAPRDDKPNPDNYDDPDAYADALADYKIAQREAAKAEESKKPDVDALADQKAQVKLKEIEFVKKQEEFRQATPNYDQNAQVVNQFLALANKNDPRFAAFSTVLLNAENPPALINYLGENPKEIMTLFNAQTPYDVSETLEGIIEKLGAPQSAGDDEEPAIMPKANLPTPPSALKSGATRVNKTVEQMSGRELLNKYAKGKIT